jgi:hypothetical protein
LTEPETKQHIFYIPQDAPALTAATACFPYAVPMTAADAALRFPQGGRRVRVTITIEELP